MCNQCLPQEIPPQGHRTPPALCSHTHICLQEVVHAGLCHFLGFLKLLHGLPELLVGDLALPLLLVVEVQAPPFQLLEVVLGEDGENREEGKARGLGGQLQLQAEFIGVRNPISCGSHLCSRWERGPECGGGKIPDPVH